LELRDLCLEPTRAGGVRKVIFVQTDLADDLALIEGDRIQLQQVLLNLIVNAIESRERRRQEKGVARLDPGGEKAEFSLRCETRVRGWRRRPSNVCST